jgi:hypothetical protein
MDGYRSGTVATHPTQKERIRMHVEWQGDHKMLGDDLKQDFERELRN